jgi:hypothetical protein
LLNQDCVVDEAAIKASLAHPARGIFEVLGSGYVNWADLFPSFCADGLKGAVKILLGFGLPEAVLRQGMDEARRVGQFEVLRLFDQQRDPSHEDDSLRPARGGEFDSELVSPDRLKHRGESAPVRDPDPAKRRRCCQVKAIGQGNPEGLDRFLRDDWRDRFNGRDIPGLSDLCDFLGHDDVCLMDFAFFCGSVDCAQHLVNCGCEVNDEAIRCALANNPSPDLFDVLSRDRADLFRMACKLGFQRAVSLFLAYDLPDGLLHECLGRAKEAGQAGVVLLIQAFEAKCLLAASRPDQVAAIWDDDADRLALLLVPGFGDAFDVTRVLEGPHLESMGRLLDASKARLMELACFWGRGDCVALLVARGCQVTDAAVICAMQNPVDEVLGTLNLQDETVQRVFPRACGLNLVEVVRWITTSGVVRETTLRDGLNTASETGAIDVVRFLVPKHVALRDHKLCAGEKSPLHSACKSGHIDVVAHLLAHGAPSGELDSTGRTPIACALESGHLGCVCFLWSQGAVTPAVSGALSAWKGRLVHEDVLRAVFERHEHECLVIAWTTVWQFGLSERFCELFKKHIPREQRPLLESSRQALAGVFGADNAPVRQTEGRTSAIRKACEERTLGAVDLISAFKQHDRLVVKVMCEKAEIKEMIHRNEPVPTAVILEARDQDFLKGFDYDLQIWILATLVRVPEEQPRPRRLEPEPVAPPVNVDEEEDDAEADGVATPEPRQRPGRPVFDGALRAAVERDKPKAFARAMAAAAQTNPILLTADGRCDLLTYVTMVGAPRCTEVMAHLLPLGEHEPELLVSACGSGVRAVVALVRAEGEQFTRECFFAAVGSGNVELAREIWESRPEDWEFPGLRLRACRSGAVEMLEFVDRIGAGFGDGEAEIAFEEALRAGNEPMASLCQQPLSKASFLAAIKSGDGACIQLVWEEGKRRYGGVDALLALLELSDPTLFFEMYTARDVVHLRTLRDAASAAGHDDIVDRLNEEREEEEEVVRVPSPGELVMNALEQDNPDAMRQIVPGVNEHLVIFAALNREKPRILGMCLDMHPEYLSLVTDARVISSVAMLNEFLVREAEGDLAKLAVDNNRIDALELVVNAGYSVETIQDSVDPDVQATCRLAHEPFNKTRSDRMVANGCTTSIRPPERGFQPVRQKGRYNNAVRMTAQDDIFDWVALCDEFGLKLPGGGELEFVAMLCRKGLFLHALHGRADSRALIRAILSLLAKCRYAMDGAQLQLAHDSAPCFTSVMTVEELRRLLVPVLCHYAAHMQGVQPLEWLINGIKARVSEEPCPRIEDRTSAACDMAAGIDAEKAMLGYVQRFALLIIAGGASPDGVFGPDLVLADNEAVRVFLQEPPALFADEVVNAVKADAPGMRRHALWTPFKLGSPLKPVSYESTRVHGYAPSTCGVVLVVLSRMDIFMLLPLNAAMKDKGLKRQMLRLGVKQGLPFYFIGTTLRGEEELSVYEVCPGPRFTSRVPHPRGGAVQSIPWSYDFLRGDGIIKKPEVLTNAFLVGDENPRTFVWSSESFETACMRMTRDGNTGAALVQFKGDGDWQDPRVFRPFKAVDDLTRSWSKPRPYWPDGPEYFEKGWGPFEKIRAMPEPACLGPEVIDFLLGILHRGDKDWEQGMVIVQGIQDPVKQSTARVLLDLKHSGGSMPTIAEIARTIRARHELVTAAVSELFEEQIDVFPVVAEIPQPPDEDRHAQAAANPGWAEARDDAWNRVRHHCLREKLYAIAGHDMANSFEPGSALQGEALCAELDISEPSLARYRKLLREHGVNLAPGRDAPEARDAPTAVAELRKPDRALQYKPASDRVRKEERGADRVQWLADCEAIDAKIDAIEGNQDKEQMKLVAHELLACRHLGEHAPGCRVIADWCESVRHTAVSEYKNTLDTMIKALFTRRAPGGGA